MKNAIVQRTRKSRDWLIERPVPQSGSVMVTDKGLIDVATGKVVRAI